MIELIKRIIISNSITRSIYHFFRYLLLTSTCKKPYFQKNSFNKKLIIIGNGPSLANDKQKLINSNYSDFMCVNDFAKTDLFKKIKPKYYILMDSYFFQDNVHEMWIRSREELFNFIEKDTEWEMTIYLPHYADISIIKDKVKNSLIKIIKLPHQTLFSRKYNSLIKILYDINFYCPPQVNVLVSAIFIGIKLKYSELNIYGADLSFHNDVFVNQETNVPYIMHRHYGNQNEQKKFTKNPANIELWRMSDFLALTANTFYGHEMNAKYAHSKKIIIKNLSSFSMIDAYIRG
jgi:hypothetical protein